MKIYLNRWNSIFSVLYNGAEGVVSILFGVDSSSHALVFFGIQSGIEVFSAVLVTWRFARSISDEDTSDATPPDIVRVEKIASMTIGFLLVLLAVAAVGISIASLVIHEHPNQSNAALIIAGSTIFITFLLWVPKHYLAHALNSSTMQGEALCALSCIQFSAVLLIGSLIYRVWHGGWWVDSATTIVIALLFGWEGIKMVRWARSKDFSGGCCGSSCSKSSTSLEKGLEKTVNVVKTVDAAETVDTAETVDVAETADVAKTVDAVETVNVAQA